MTPEKQKPISKTAVILSTESESEELLRSMPSKYDYEGSESTKSDNYHD